MLLARLLYQYLYTHTQQQWPLLHVCCVAVVLFLVYTKPLFFCLFIILRLRVCWCVCNNIDKKWKRGGGGGRLPCFAYDYILYSIYVVVVVDVECPSSTYRRGDASLRILFSSLVCL